jgi:hypothetical protein
MDELLAATGTKENEDGEIVYAGKFWTILIDFIFKILHFIFNLKISSTKS